MYFKLPSELVDDILLLDHLLGDYFNGTDKSSQSVLGHVHTPKLAIAKQTSKAEVFDFGKFNRSFRRRRLGTQSKGATGNRTVHFYGAGLSVSVTIAIRGYSLSQSHWRLFTKGSALFERLGGTLRLGFPF